MRRFWLLTGGLFLALVAVVILWNSPFWYTNEEDNVPAILTQIAAVALIVDGGLVAFLAAWCLGRAFVPLKLAPAVSGSAPAEVGGGPVLPLCGLLFLLAAVGSLRWSQYGAREYAGAQGKLDKIQDWAVELDRRLMGAGRTFAVLWLAIGVALLITSLVLKPSVWQFRRRLNRVGRKYAIGGLLLSVLGILVWFFGALGNAVGGIAGGGHSSPFLSFVGYLGIIAGAIVAVVGSIIAVAGESEVGK